MSFSCPVIRNSFDPKFFDYLENSIKDLRKSPHSKEVRKEAIEEFFRLLDLDNIHDVEKMYDYIFELMPSFYSDEFGRLLNILSRFLKRYPGSLLKQRELALQLAHQQCDVPPKGCKLSSYHLAMSFYAKALQISLVQNDTELTLQCHGFSSFLLIKAYLRSGLFKDRLERATKLYSEVKHNARICLELIELIPNLNRFCYSLQDQQILGKFYAQATEVINSIPEGQKEYFNESLQLIGRLRDQKLSISKENYATIHYWEALKSWRDRFNQENFGTELLSEFKIFFKLLIDDAFIILGKPPCAFDIQAMGSFGREEPCPFSDLELYVLYADSKARHFFEALLQILELQLNSLGENCKLPIVFTCIHRANPSGLYLDAGGNPNVIPHLFIIPNFLGDRAEEKIASLDTSIRESKGDPVTVEHTCLKSVSLFSYSPAELIQTYRRDIAAVLDAEPQNPDNLPLRQQWALDLIKRRLTNREGGKAAGFLEMWTCPPPLKDYNIKERFVQYLNLLLADIALYWDIPATNTLDIVDSLVSKCIFALQTGNLLKDLITQIYLLRIKLHQRYQMQREEAYLTSVSDYTLTQAEEELLEKTYWLILKPLYHALRHVFRNENVQEIKQRFETTFHNLDLVQQAFEEVLNRQDTSRRTRDIERISYLAKPILTQSCLRKFIDQFTQNTLILFEKSHLTEIDMAALVSTAWLSSRLVAFNCKEEIVLIHEATLQSHFKDMLGRGNIFFAEVLRHIVGPSIFSIRGERNRNLLHLYASEDFPEVLLYLIQNGILINEQDQSGYTPLIIATKAGKLANMQILVDHKAELEKADTQGKTALCFAIIFHNEEIATFLLEQGANIGATDRNGATILHYAASSPNTNILRLILQSPRFTNELLNRENHDGRTPLHEATLERRHKPGIVRLLLEAGSQADAASGSQGDPKEAWKYTPLHWAAKNGDLESCRLLLAWNAPLYPENKNGDTPLDLAIRHGKDSVARLLIDPKAESGDEPSLGIDLEGDIYQKFEQAYADNNGLDQILYLEKLADYYLDKKQDHFTAALVLNNALAAAKLYQFHEKYQELLLAKLERIAGYFLLDKLGIYTPLKAKNYILHYRHILETIRHHAKLQMEHGSCAEKIQTEMNVHFQKLLITVIEDSAKLLQFPLTDFAVLALGSMARGEMSLFSDVEFAFLIKTETAEIRSRCRNLARFLQLILINCGETHYPLIRPKQKNIDPKSFTPQGFSLDNKGLSPLGKEGIYEFIGTPQQLADFQTPEWVEKHSAEIIVVNSLSAGTYLCGDQSLVNSYQKKCHKILNSGFFPPLRCLRALTLLRGHLEDFKPRLDENRLDIRGFDIKKDLYRPFQMVISCLAIWKGLSVNNTIEQIQALTPTIFSESNGKRLISVLYQIYALRIKTQLFYRCEKEIVCQPNSQDSSVEDFYILKSEEMDELREIYRVLIPFMEAAKAFAQGKEKIFGTSLLYSPTIGDTNYTDPEDQLDYREALTLYTQNAALLPDDLQALDNLQRLQLRWDRAEDALKSNQLRLTILKRQYQTGLSMSFEERLKMADAYDNIGISLTNLGCREEALENFKQALELRLEVLDPHSLEIAQSYHHIAKEYASLGNSEDSIFYNKKALEIREKKGSLLERAETYNALGIALGEKGEIEEVYKNLKKALSLRIEALGTSHPDVATIYSNLGFFESTYLNKHTEALEHNKRAFDILLKKFGEKHSKILELYARIIENLRILGRNQEAEKLLGQFIPLIKRKYGPNSIRLAVHFSNCGMALKQAKKFDKAMPYFLMALEIFQKEAKQDLSGIGLCYNNMGMCLSDQARHQEALNFLEKAVHNWEQAYGKDHLYTARAYHNKAIVLIHLKQYESALLEIEKSIKIRESSPSNILDLSASFKAKGVILKKLQSQEANIWLEKAQNLSKSIPNSEDALSNVGCVNLKEKAKIEPPPQEFLTPTQNTRSIAREFTLAGLRFRRCFTRADGLCAIHALLGTEENGEWRWNGTRQEIAKLLENEFAKGTFSKLRPLFRAFFEGLMDSFPNDEYDVDLKKILKDPICGLKRKIEKLKADLIPLNSIRFKILQPIFHDLCEIDLSLKTEINKLCFDGTKQLTLDQAIAAQFSDIETWLTEKAKLYPELEGHLEQLSALAQKFNAGQALIDKEFVSFIQQWFAHYMERFKQNTYYLTHLELEMVAHLYEKEVFILTQERLLSNVISFTGNPIIIWHEGVHFERCKQIT